MTDVVVIGLGYVGLPLVQAAANAGLVVRGFDASERVVEGLNAGRSHVDDLSNEDVAAILATGFRASSDVSVLADTDAAVICVPTPLSAEGAPDLDAVISATRAIGAHLRPGMLVVLESTTYPGTTEEVVLPILEESGLRAGVDFFLAFSPERIDPGNPRYGLRNTPKVVGGVNADSTEAASIFYGKFIDQVVRAAGTREAEMAKLLENTYRHVNIALMNELLKFSRELGVDLWNAIDCAETKPFGFQAFYPGPGVGGHCIPIDPNYLSYKVRARLGYPFRFVELAQEINASMPAYTVRRMQDMLNDEGKALRGARVLLIGVTYKANIADQRESPARPIAEQLRAKGAVVSYHDPFVSRWELASGALERADELLAAARDADISVLLQNHSQYDLDELQQEARLILDTRGVMNPDQVGRL